MLQYITISFFIAVDTIRSFHTMAGFLNVIGAKECTHVPMKYSLKNYSQKCKLSSTTSRLLCFLKQHFNHLWCFFMQMRVAVHEQRNLDALDLFTSTWFNCVYAHAMNINVCTGGSYTQI